MDWLNLLLGWDWTTIVKTAAGAFVGSGTATVAYSFYRDRRQMTAQARHLAALLAVLLEKYAYTCTEFMDANENAPHDPKNEFPKWNVKLPELPPFPEDIEGWRALDRKLAERCLALRNRIALSQGLINSTGEYEEHMLGEELDRQAAEVGIEAWETARALRSKYKMVKPHLVFDYSDWLYRSRDSAKKKKEEAATSQAKAWSLAAPRESQKSAP